MPFKASSKNVVEWNANMDLVKAANNGGYPSWWLSEVILSGFAARMVDVMAKNKAAVSLGRKGGIAAAGKGAFKFWSTKTPEERSEEMSKRARLMWKKRKEKPPWST